MAFVETVWFYVEAVQFIVEVVWFFVEGVRFQVERI
jgi:hypothetical protein